MVSGVEQNSERNIGMSSSSGVVGAELLVAEAVVVALLSIVDVDALRS